jgi:glycosyltransferase involved in cell wall biosynthesis
MYSSEIVAEMTNIRPAVVVHAGARDNYQLALALSEHSLLQSLVTNVCVKKMVKEKYNIDLSTIDVKMSYKALAAFVAMKLIKSYDLHNYSDRALSLYARDIANGNNCSLFAYSYYASQAFKPGSKRPRNCFLFQLHPHPKSVRAILSEEVERVPSGRQSLEKEAELMLSPEAFAELANEPHLADGCVVASSYTRNTLVENGIEFNKVHVVPYGVDLSCYAARTVSPALHKPFTVMFLGSLVQRKGLSYLLDAIRLLKSKHIRVALRGRGNVDSDLLQHYSDLDVDLQLNLPTKDIIQSLYSTDLFILPSLVEGFAHVILQAMGCGVPVITTANTCGPDIINEGQEGFIVPIRNAEAIAAKIQWGIDNREELAFMGQTASLTAREFTWSKFRSGIIKAYVKMSATTEK